MKFGAGRENPEEALNLSFQRLKEMASGSCSGEEGSAAGRKYEDMEQ